MKDTKYKRCMYGKCSNTGIYQVDINFELSKHMQTGGESTTCATHLDKTVAAMAEWIDGIPSPNVTRLVDLIEGYQEYLD